MKTSELPLELELRGLSISSLVVAGMIMSLIIMSVARLSNSGVYLNLSKAMLKVNGLSMFIRETFPLRNGSSILLLINYFISGSVLVFLLLEYLGAQSQHSFVLSASIVLGVFLFNSAGILLISWLSGEYKRLREALQMKLIGAEFFGILFFAVSLIWILQPSIHSTLFKVVVVMILCEVIFRIIKSATIVYRNGAPWYYIILYLCTLEILPAIMVYYYYAD